MRETREKGDRAVAIPLPPRSVLLVDDNPAIRTALHTILTDAGYEVSVASDGEAAISICNDRTVDLLITDLIMPEKEGIQTIQHFKKASPHSKIIAMSGGDPTFLKAALLLGAHKVLLKPIRSAELLDAVRTVLS